jgi:hypothetical protein
MGVAPTEAPADPAASSPLLAALSDAPKQARTRLADALRRTPGWLSWMLVALLVLSLCFGVFGALTVTGKRSTLADLTAHQQPVTAAAQQIYRSLSEADATEASGFLAGGTASDARRRYRQDLAKAGSAVAVAASEFSPEGSTGQALRILSTQLPVYNGLAQTAKTNRRLEQPVAASYLLQANGLMRTTLLPAARALYTAETTRLAARQVQAAAVPWGTVGIVVLLGGMLVYAQRYLRRKTNRLFNVGLLVASGALLLAVVWGGVEVGLVAVHMHTARQKGSEQVATLTRARIAAVTARADETLGLVARDRQDAFETGFAEARTRLLGQGSSHGLLGDATAAASGTPEAGPVQEAVRSADAWFAVHGKIRRLEKAGHTKKAATLAVGNDPTSAASQFHELDEDLATGIGQGRREFKGGVSSARDSLIGLEAGVIALALVCAGGATVGIWQRLWEYR